MSELLESIVKRTRGVSPNDALKFPIQDNPKGTRLARLLKGESTQFASITVGDLIYDAVRLDPMVIEGIDFARSEDLGDIANFARFAEDVTERTGASLTGTMSNLEGFVAERLVAQILSKQGAEISFPDTPNQAGYDILVNSEPVQVKCVKDSDLVAEHLSRYPDIHVIVNEEVSSDFEGNEMVSTLGGFRKDEVAEETQKVLDAGSGLLDFQVPLAVTAVVGFKYVVAYANGSTDFLSATQGCAIDWAGRVAGAHAGSLAMGASLGLFGATGGWISIVGPLFGTIGGFQAGKHISEGIKSLFCRHELEELRKATTCYADQAATAIDNMMGTAELKRKKLLGKVESGSYVSAALKADWNARFEAQKNKRLLLKKQLLDISEKADAHGIGETIRNALCAASRAGLTPFNLRQSADALERAIQKYVEHRKRYLLHGSI